jgi:hypothetical protein
LKRTPFPDRRKPMGRMVKDGSNGPQPEPEPQTEATAAMGRVSIVSQGSHSKRTPPAHPTQQNPSQLTASQMERFLRTHHVCSAGPFGDRPFPRRSSSKIWRRGQGSNRLTRPPASPAQRAFLEPRGS